MPVFRARRLPAMAGRRAVARAPAMAGRRAAARLLATEGRRAAAPLPSTARLRVAAWLPVAAWLAAALLAAGPLGCARARPAPPPADLPVRMPSEEEAARVAPGAPEALPPAAGADLDREPVARPLVILPAGQGDARAPNAAAQDSAVTPEPERTRPGFRVQLLATGDAGLARQRAEEYRGLFEQGVHVVLREQLFKVQVGDCATREEAEALRRQALGLGYAGAFIVETPVAAR